MEEEKTYIFEGKTTNEAIEKGLKELNKTKNQVEIKVLENDDKKTFFSILAPKIVKVEMKIKNTNIEPKNPKEMEEVIKEIDKFVKKIIENLPTKDLEYDVKFEDNIVKINIKDEEAAYLIGYRGETLNSLQSIISSIASNDKQEKVRVMVNIGKYREKREKDLQILAKRIAESVIKTRKAITLEPMIAYDRKIIHSALQENDKVTTHSIGKEPYRKVIVSLK